MSVRTFSVIASLALLQFAASTSVAVAESNNVLFEAKADETIRVRVAGTGDDKRTVIEQQKVDFHHVTLWGGAKDTPDRQVIAKETLTPVIDNAKEGTESKLRVDLFFAKENMGKFPTQPSQTIELPNTHEADFEDAYWKASTFGCCDAEPYSRLYAYGSDKPFLRYNEDFWKVEVPNAHPLDRYVGMVIRGQVPNDAAEEAIFGKQKNAVAAVSVAAVGKPLDTIYLVPKEGVDASKFSLHTEKLELRGDGPKDEIHPNERMITLWSLDGAEPATAGAKAVKGVTVTAGIYVDDETTETLQVQIQDDKFARPTLQGTKLRIAH